MPSETQETSEGPKLIWKAPPVAAEYNTAKTTVELSAAVTLGGLGFALLSMAPFTHPTTFSFGLVLGCINIQLLQTWNTRQLRSNIRRHVLELTQQSKDDGTLALDILCDGGMLRNVVLTAEKAEEGKPSIGRILTSGESLITMDKEKGSSDYPELLEALMSSDRGIKEEQLKLAPLGVETEAEVARLQVGMRMDGVTIEGLEKAEKQTTPPLKPTAVFQQVSTVSQSVAAVVFGGGALLYTAGPDVNSAPPSAAGSGRRA